MLLVEHDSQQKGQQRTPHTKTHPTAKEERCAILLLQSIDPFPSARRLIEEPTGGELAEAENRLVPPTHTCEDKHICRLSTNTTNTVEDLKNNGGNFVWCLRVSPLWAVSVTP